jgi:hypothetical protein
VETHQRIDTRYPTRSRTAHRGSNTRFQRLATEMLSQGRQFTIGSKSSSWNGRTHDQSTVLVIDLSIFSMGAIHSKFPVSFRNRIAFLRSNTGWYVSGTNRVISNSWQLVLVRDARQVRSTLLTCTPDHMMTRDRITKSVFHPMFHLWFGQNVTYARRSTCLRSQHTTPY